MNDELLTLTDTRGRAAGTALQRAAMVYAWNAPAPKRPTVWLRPALVMAAVVAVIAGLVWVSGRQADPADQRDPVDLRYVIGNLPEGWTATEAHDISSTLQPNTFGMSAAVYGTRDDPTAPYAQIIWQDPNKDDVATIAGVSSMGGYSNLREVTAGERVVVCGDDLRIVHCVLSNPEGAMQLTAVGVSDALIAQMFGAVQLVEGEPFIAEDLLPAGLSPLYHGDPFGPRSVIWSSLFGPGPAVVTYSNESSDSGAGLAVGWAEDNDMVMAATFVDLTAVDVAGRSGFIGSIPSSGIREIVWRVDDRVFALYSADASHDLVAMAESVRPATSDEWSAMVVDAPAANIGDTTPAEGTYVVAPESTIEGDAPPETDVLVPPPSAIHDVAVTQTVEVVNVATSLYSCATPDGESQQVQVAVLTGQILVSDATGGGGALLPFDGTLFTNVSTMGMGVVLSDGELDGVGVVAISTDPGAAQLRVTRSNGERWVLDLVTAPGHPDVRVGAIVLPDNEFVTYDVIDAEGTVLTSNESP
ncbi:MAG: hypothetical protein ABMA25_03565 [Ilumatobacteraceae bacterium]